MSIITRIRTLTLSALTAMIVVAPGCDDGADYEALGVTVQDLEAMSPEALDALDAELEALDLSEKRELTHRPQVLPEVIDELRNPVVFTHGRRPQTRAELTVPPNPTHPGEVPAGDPDAFAAERDEAVGCDTHGDDVELAAE